MAECLILVQVFEHEANLSVVGRIGVRCELLHLLLNRLALNRDLSRHPEILAGSVQRPLFIVALPRTGTTLLHNLLALNSFMRAPLLWELRYPAVPPNWEHVQKDRRIRATIRLVNYLNIVSPSLRAIHPLAAQAPDECLHIFFASFMCVMFDAVADVRSYVTWLLEQNMSSAYRYYRQALQRLQWNAPQVPWIVKSPLHLLTLDQLLATFPDACIAFTHRDPVHVAGSGCSLFEITRAPQSDVVDRRGIGRQWLETWGTGIDRALDVRQLTGPAHFYDLHYDELMTNAPQAACRMLAHFNYPAPPDLAQRMQQWLAINPPNKYGVHRYSLALYGLTSQQIIERFDRYLRHPASIRSGVQGSETADNNSR